MLRLYTGFMFFTKCILPLSLTRRGVSGGRGEVKVHRIKTAIFTSAEITIHLALNYKPGFLLARCITKIMLLREETGFI